MRTTTEAGPAKANHEERKMCPSLNIAIAAIAKTELVIP